MELFCFAELAPNWPGTSYPTFLACLRQLRRHSGSEGSRPLLPFWRPVKGPISSGSTEVPLTGDPNKGSINTISALALSPPELDAHLPNSSFLSTPLSRFPQPPAPLACPSPPRTRTPTPVGSTGCSDPTAHLNHFGGHDSRRQVYPSCHGWLRNMASLETTFMSPRGRLVDSPSDEDFPLESSSEQSSGPSEKKEPCDSEDR
ncbi:unnamed protein product [Protopolystoma xenopodis]|uniref:Uncharacterized protein n=1 Tax=Protopolystoma xenopodis TaxID=117903 RepID=A0A3S5CTT3_9PLAT|nr:unnamed protein product [Protopolystoma xenopodis]